MIVNEISLVIQNIISFPQELFSLSVSRAVISFLSFFLLKSLILLLKQLLILFLNEFSFFIFPLDWRKSQTGFLRLQKISDLKIISFLFFLPFPDFWLCNLIMSLLSINPVKVVLSRESPLEIASSKISRQILFQR